MVKSLGPALGQKLHERPEVSTGPQSISDRQRALDGDLPGTREVKGEDQFRASVLLGNPAYKF